MIVAKWFSFHPFGKVVNSHEKEFKLRVVVENGPIMSCPHYAKDHGAVIGVVCSFRPPKEDCLT